MAYGPHTDADRAWMLAEVGIESVDELFEEIPPEARSNGLDLGEPEPEQVLAARLQALAEANDSGAVSFLGGGVYPHFIPPVVDQMLLRGEFYTAYTPYQPEISQGTLQAVYEYQSLIAELTGLDAVSASHYDGATATAEAALMAIRATGRERILVGQSLHPHFTATLRTYLMDRFGLGVIPGAPDGTTDLIELEQRLSDAGEPVAGVVLAQPNFLGVIEDMAAAADLAHSANSMFIAAVEPISLAVLSSPGECGADIAVGEGQPLGIAPQYGGPYLGILACREGLARQIPGRLVGRTVDLEGRPAYVMTLRAREQDIRRERAASNICTNQALCALAAAVYVAVMGPTGLRDVALTGAARARELLARLEGIGLHRVHNAPFLNEFAVRLPDASAVHRRLCDRGVIAGLPLADFYPGDPELRDALLLSTTELTTAEDIDRLVSAIKEER